MTYKTKMTYYRKKTEYKKFRVRGHIRSFRDLEIYKYTTKLSSQIFGLELPPNLKNRAWIKRQEQYEKNK
jgi:hypothetical protein